ncbi:MAG: hypothetical protein JO250_09035 [Armatimonadetes bacterium]|nr:hypothetical protein [Armatimonadota bacterium]
MSKAERVTVSFEVSRSRNYQSVKFGLSEEIVLDDGDDRDAVVKAARARLFKEVSDTASRALEHLLPPQQEA